jgi:pimeloyl-ACP methyl ester carboxylesterase
LLQFVKLVTGSDKRISDKPLQFMTEGIRKNLHPGKVYRVVNKFKRASFSFNRCLFTFFAVCFCLFWFVSAAQAELKLVKEFEGRDSSPWERIEQIKDTNRNFTFEKFHYKSRRTHSITYKAFGSNTPHSSRFLLHFAPNWNKATHPVPILLVHGAGDNATRGFAHPWVFDIPEDGKIEKPGIMQNLVKKGFSVFAITFSHPHGDNFLQAQQIANAINRIRQVTGADKVDVLCHSKGAMSVRIYASDLGEEYPKYSWITPYQNDIRKILFVASPLKGIDTAFRYYAYNFTVMYEDMAAPLGATIMTWQGQFAGTEKHNELFPGQFQMLHNWVKDGIPFNYQSSTPDMNTTRKALYFGGSTTLVSSDGIDATIQKAGDVINSLCRKGIDPSITCHILAGSKQEIDKVKFFWFEFPVGEFADSSDGVLFLKSATYKKGLTARGAKIGSVKVLNTHHVGVTVLPAALDHISEVFSERDINKEIR